MKWLHRSTCGWYRRCKSRIEDGTYPLGALVPSENQLVQTFGMSRPTVVRALELLKRDGWWTRFASSALLRRSCRTSGITWTGTGFGDEGHVFLGAQDGRLRRGNFRGGWLKALAAAGLSAGVHFHDLWHTGNTLVSRSGASTRELMTRVGHSTSRAVLIYQHMTGDRDRAIADGLGAMIRKNRETDEIRDGGEHAP